MREIEVELFTGLRAVRRKYQRCGVWGPGEVRFSASLIGRGCGCHTLSGSRIIDGSDVNLGPHYPCHALAVRGDSNLIDHAAVTEVGENLVDARGARCCRRGSVLTRGRKDG